MTERLRPLSSDDVDEPSIRDVLTRVEQAGKAVHMLRLFANAKSVF